MASTVHKISKTVKSSLPGFLGIDDFIGNFLVRQADKLLNPDIPTLETNQDLTTGNAANRTRIYGETVVSGPIVKYSKETESKKEYHHFFTPLANHQCKSVNLYQLDGKSNTAMTGEGYRLIARLGDQTSTQPLALSEMSNVDSSFVGFGITDVYHKYEINTELFPNGVQDVKFLVKGASVYDPRKDSEQGGDGAHRYDDPTTWEWSDNAALVNFDWKRLGGDIELGLELFDLTNIAHEANLCDELVNITTASGQTVTEKRYTCNGVVDLSEKPKSVEDSLLMCCAGQWIFSGGTYYFAVGAYRGPAVTTITESDLKGTVGRNASTPLEDRCNAVTSTFISKALYYQKTDSTPIKSNFYYNNRDKKRYLEHDRTFNFVQTDTHAQRLNRQYMEYLAAGDTLSVPVGWVGLKCPRGTTVYVNLPGKTIVGKEYEVIDNQYDIVNQSWQLTLRETAVELYADTIVPAESDLTPNTNIDNTFVAPVESVLYTPTPNDSFRLGVLTWEHPISESVRKYIALILREPADDWYYTESPLTPTMDIRNLPAGTYTALVSAENRFGRRSVAPSYSFNVGLPNTPSDTAMRVDILPGRVVIVGPDLPNSAATYEWRYSFTDDFASALTAADGKGVTIVGTRQDDTLYLWYRLKEGDLVDPNWIQVVIPHLIGLTSDEIRPDVIAGITLPSLPNTLLDTISGFASWLNDQDYYNEELEAKQISLFEDIQMVNDALAIVDEKTTTVGVEVGLVSAKVAQAFRAISSDRMSRAILESKLQAQFGDLSSVYLKTVDLYTSAGAARASDLTQLGVTVGNVNAKAENNLILIAQEQQARISDITERRIATEAVDAKATNSLQLIADEEQARIEDITQRRLATEAVDAKADNSLELIATETQARIDDIETRRVATAAVDAKADNALQLIADEEQARIDDIEQRRVATAAVDAKAVNALSLIATETQARIDDIEQRRIATVAATAKADNALSLIADEEAARIQLGQQLTSTFNNSLASYVKQSELFSSAGAARASDLATVSARVGSSSVASQITSFKNAQIGYENSSGNWVQGAAFAQAFSEVKITGSLGNNLSIYSYFEAIENELGQVSGEIQFAVNNDGRITGVFVKGSSTQSVLTFVGNSIRIVATNGTTLMSVNASTNRMTIYADGEFTGALISAEHYTIGTNYMKVEVPGGFGSEGVWWWFGPKKLLSNGKIDLSYCTKRNASVWFGTEGDSYFGGGISGGVLYAGRTSTTKAANPSVETGRFGTNGNPKKVVVTFSMNGNYVDYSYSGNPPSSYPNSATLKLYRAKNGSSSFTQVGVTQYLSGEATFIDMRGEGLGVRSFEFLGGSYTYTDTDSSTQDFEYRAVITSQSRYHATQNISRQELALVSTEV